jgi:hypothetical protein
VSIETTPIILSAIIPAVVAVSNVEAANTNI